MVWKMVYGRKGEIIQQGTETVSLSLRSFFFFFWSIRGVYEFKTSNQIGNSFYFHRSIFSFFFFLQSN